MLTKVKIEADNAPKAIGPYSRCLVVGEHVYVSGQLGLDPSSMQVISEDFEMQARKALENIKLLLVAAGSSLDQVVKLEVFLTDMNNFVILNEILKEIFTTDTPPVRQTIEVSALPKWGKVMMSCEAIVQVV